MANSIKIGGFSFDALKIGGSDVDAAYLGDTLVYSGGTPPSANPKFILKYTDETVYSAECDSSSAITSAMTSGGTSNFSGVTDVTVGDCITEIGARAFTSLDGNIENISNLSSITIGNNVTTIRQQAFIKATGGTMSITIPSGVTYIGAGAFESSSITGVTFQPSYISTIDTNAFVNCDIRELELPQGYYKSQAFAGNQNLTSVSFKQLEGNYQFVLGNSMFLNCHSLSSVTLPTTVINEKSISPNCFSYCYSLSSITIPYGFSMIQDANDYYQGAFYGCSALTSVTLHNDFKQIGSYAFYDCPLSSITIPSGVTYIGVGAFQNCPLSSITINSTTAPSGVTDTTFANTNNCPIYVPCEAYGSYLADSGWTSYISRINANVSNERWTETTATTCVDGDKYAIDVYEWTCDGTNWLTSDVTRQGRMVESASTDCQVASDYVFSAYNLRIASGMGTKAIEFEDGGVEFSGQSNYKITGSSTYQTDRLSGKTQFDVTTTNGVAMNSITFVQYNSSLVNSFINGINNGGSLSDYTMTSGTCTINNTTRYWVRYELNDGATPVTSVYSNTTSTTLILWIAINVDNNWVNNLPPS